MSTLHTKPFLTIFISYKGVDFTAIYHLSVKIIKRSEGRSAAAAAAYRSGTSITSEWDGVTYDYTKKKWIEHSEILLPEYAPEKFKDRQNLWNNVEMSEKYGNAQLAREFEIALPVELSRENQISLVREFVQKNCVDKGMCADIAIHDPPVRDDKGCPLDQNGNRTNDLDQMVFRNPHAHVMVTMRPLTVNGKWEPKYEKSYLCRKDQEECPFPASKIKEAEADGWKKQYRYYFGKKKIWLTADAAAKEELERVDKQPKIKNIPNSTIANWNSTETLESWRESWEDLCNQALKENGIDSRIDHRSYAEQGIDRIPGVHMGPQVLQMEKKGIPTELGSLNREIKKNNEFLDGVQKELDKIAEQEKENLRKTCAQLEVLRDRYLISAYQQAIYSASLADEETSVQKQIASANANAKAVEQTMKAIEKLMNLLDVKTKELSSCSLFQRKKREELKQEIVRTEKELAEVKERLKDLERKKEALQTNPQTDQEVLKEKRKRIQYFKKMQSEQYKEFYRLVGENKEYMGKLREIMWTGRESHDRFVEKRLMDYYQEEYQSELLTQLKKDAPDLPKESKSYKEKTHERMR